MIMAVRASSGSPCEGPPAVGPRRKASQQEVQTKRPEVTTNSPNEQTWAVSDTTLLHGSSQFKVSLQATASFTAHVKQITDGCRCDPGVRGQTGVKQVPVNVNNLNCKICNKKKVFFQSEIKCVPFHKIRTIMWREGSESLRSYRTEPEINHSLYKIKALTPAFGKPS